MRNAIHLATLGAVLVLVLSACGGAGDTAVPPAADAEAEAEAPASPDSGPVADPTDEAAAPPGPGATGARGAADDAKEQGANGAAASNITDRKGNPVAEVPFDPASVAQSDATLGDIPFLGLPDGYAVINRPKRLDFARFPFRMGEGLHWVEGQAWAGRIGIERSRRREKEFSALELRRNLEAALAQAGAVKVFEGPLQRDMYYGSLEDEVGQPFIEGVNLDAGIPTTVHVIRQPDRTIWVQLSIGGRQAGMVAVEEKALELTAGLLPASALKQQLDADGRVAIQVNFAVDKADILPDSQPQIDQVLALLREDPALRLSVDGHTDATGDAAHNLRLSEARAASVVAALASRGIEGSRLEARGHGQSQPVADNTTEDGRARNRRVELVRLQPAVPL